jgi:hypothetical protein
MITMMNAISLILSWPRQLAKSVLNVEVELVPEL